MKKQPCNCPAYDFPHRQGGGRCDLPDTCDFMFSLECTDPEGGYCDYADDCPLLNAIDHHRMQFDRYRYDETLSPQERNLDFRSW